MKGALISWAAAFTFAVGLGLAGMTQPEKVRGFLDVAGHWDPTLALVMASAVGVTATLFPLILRRKVPLWAESFHLPTRTDIDVPLLGGAALFGVGWGLAGYCPGPALTSLATGDGTVVSFVIAMAVGSYVGGWVSSATTGAASDDD